MNTADIYQRETTFLVLEYVKKSFYLWNKAFGPKPAFSFLKEWSQIRMKANNSMSKLLADVTD